jgi:hypothetical protein
VDRALHCEMIDFGLMTWSTRTIAVAWSLIPIEHQLTAVLVKVLQRNRSIRITKEKRNVFKVSPHMIVGSGRPAGCRSQQELLWQSWSWRQNSLLFTGPLVFSLIPFTTLHEAH